MISLGVNYVQVPQIVIFFDEIQSILTNHLKNSVNVMLNNGRMEENLGSSSKLNN